MYNNGALPAAVTQRTVKDKEFVFCSTVGNATAQYSTAGGTQYQYYFTRSNPNDSRADFDNIPRNRQLYYYLQCLTGGSPAIALSSDGSGEIAVASAGPVPGFGGSTFLQKYGNGPSGNTSDRDQILTEIFDYIRCINLSDTSGGAAQFTPANVNGPIANSGQVVPIQINQTRGFGRFPTITEAAIHFSWLDATHMKAVVLLEAFVAAYGYEGIKDTYSVGIESLATGGIAVSVPGQPTTFPILPVGNLSPKSIRIRFTGGTDVSWEDLKASPTCFGIITAALERPLGQAGMRSHTTKVPIPSARPPFP